MSPQLAVIDAHILDEVELGVATAIAVVAEIVALAIVADEHGVAVRYEAGAGHVAHLNASGISNTEGRKGEDRHGCE